MENKGVTLVSLVVTIIILIILAGTSINLTIGEEGIFTIAKRAKENMELAQVEEQERLNALYIQLDSPEIRDDLYTNENNNPSQGEEGDVQVKENHVTYKELKNGDRVPIPNGFYYVGGTLTSGVVISDDDKDENKYATELQVPVGVQYNENDGNKNESYSELKGNQFVWIPCTNENYEKVIAFPQNGSGFDQYTNSAERTQIKKYGGFYVGRYEAGTSGLTVKNNHTFGETESSGWQNTNFTVDNIESGTIHTKGGEIPYYHADYKTAVKMSEKMYENKEHVDSGLMTGTMWDAMMKYIAKNCGVERTKDDDYNNLTKQTWGNYNDTQLKGKQGTYLNVNNSGSVVGKEKASLKEGTKIYGILTTGSTEQTRICNLYDIAGNLWEWTQEACYSGVNYYYLRGGSFSDSYTSYPVAYRENNVTTYTNTFYGFRPALYIK